MVVAVDVPEYRAMLAGGTATSVALATHEIAIVPGRSFNFNACCTIILFRLFLAFHPPTRRMNS